MQKRKRPPEKVNGTHKQTTNARDSQGLDNAVTLEVERTLMNSDDEEPVHNGGGLTVGRSESDSSGQVNSRRSEDEWPKRRNMSSTTNSASEGDRELRVVLWEDLATLLKVPVDDNQEPTLHNINETSEEFQSSFHSLWQQVTRHQSYKKLIDGRINSFPNGRHNPNKCIWHSCNKTLEQNNKFKKGGVSRMSADDHCIRKPVPCTYFIEHNGRTTRCVVPLPEGLRAGKVWTDIGFWVVGIPQK
jgi:hypothetical protein